MKRTKILIILLLANTILVVGQNRTFHPPKKVNTIIIEKKDTAIHFLIDYAKHLQDVGYTIEKLDKDFLTFSTDYKNYKFSGVAVLKIIAFARQNGPIARLEIRGKIEVSNASGGQFPLEACNCGMKGNAKKNAFIEILKTLDDLKFRKIEFLKK